MDYILKQLIEGLTEIEQIRLRDIIIEYQRAIDLHPRWPEDKIHAASIVCEESGELIRATLRNIYEGGKPIEMETEAIQTGATVLRFLTNLQ